MGGAVLSKSLTQFSVDGRGCVSSLLFDLRPNYGGGGEDNAASFRRSHAGTATLSAPSPAAGHRRPTPPPETPGHSQQVWVSLLWGRCSFLMGPGAQGSVCALQESVSPGLCKFWWLDGGDHGDLLQEGLCYTQVCCTQSPYPCSRPLLTRTSSGDTKIQFCLSLCGVSGSWCAQGLFEPSEHLWWLWGLILNMILPLLPS